MKKKTFLLLLLCAIPAAASREGDPSTQVGKEALGIAYLLPQRDSDFSDLDVRDAQNNPIQSPSASQELEVLFRENLVNLTVFASLHVTTEALTWMDSFSHLFNRSIFTRLSTAFDALQDVLLPSSRRFVHNVDNLCITFSVGVFAGCILLSAFSLQRSPRNVHLRC
jgi:hypothetical protein